MQIRKFWITPTDEPGLFDLHYGDLGIIADYCDKRDLLRFLVKYIQNPLLIDNFNLYLYV